MPAFEVILVGNFEYVVFVVDSFFQCGKDDFMMRHRNDFFETKSLNFITDLLHKWNKQSIPKK